MKVYELEVAIKSPTLITFHSAGNILSHSGSYLPGSTVRGALLGKIYEENPERVKEEAENPTITFHPAYPVVEGEKSTPAHSLTYICKVCGRIFRSPLLDSRRKLGNLIVDRLEQPVKCPNNHYLAVKSIGGQPYTSIKGEMKVASLRYTVSHSTGINRALRSSEIGLFYSYIAIAPGTRFKGLVADPEDKIPQLLGDTGNSVTVRIGRGSSRGLGKAAIKLKEKPDYLQRRAEIIEQVLRDTGNTLVLRALSPTFTISMSASGPATSPTPSINVKGIKPKPIHSSGKNYILTGLTSISGYSKITNLPKISVKAARQGSIYFYNVESPSETIYEEIARLEALGTPPFNQLGLNILEVYGYELPA